MKTSIRDGCELRRILPAVPSAVEEFYAEFRECAQDRLASADCFAAELLVRELLNNALVHGCRSDPRSSFQCMVRLNDRRLAIAVEDGGEGFDWRAALAHTAQLSEESGRGMAIFLRYATRVRFNHKGNAVTIVKRF